MKLLAGFSMRKILSPVFSLRALLFLLGASLSVIATPVLSEEQEEQHFFLQIGELRLSDSESTIDVGGSTFEGEFDDIPYFAAGVQKILSQGRFRYGYEGGAVLAWEVDSVRYRVQGSSVQIKVKNDFALFGTMLGAYGDMRLGNRTRLFVSGGPMILFGSLAQEDDGGTASPASTVVVGKRDRENKLGYGAYASAGIGVRFSDTAELGVVVRRQETELEFSNSFASVPNDGTQVMLSLGYLLQ